MKKVRIISVIVSMLILGCINKPPIINANDTNNSNEVKSTPLTVLTPTPTFPINTVVPSSIPNIDTVAIPSVTSLPGPPVIYSYDNTVELKTSKLISGYINPIISMNQAGNFIFSYLYTRKVENANNIENPVQSYQDTYVTLFDNKNSGDLEIKKESVPNSILLDNEGNFTILYTDANGEIFIRKYSSNGSPLTNEISISTPDPNVIMNMYANISMNSDGDLLISWVVGNLMPDPYVGDGIYKQFQSVNIFRQKLSSSLKPISDIEMLKVDKAYHGINIQPRFDKNNNYYITWENEGQIGLIKYDKNLKFVFNKPALINTQDTYGTHNSIFDSNNNLIITWVTPYETNPGIYVRKYSNNLETYKDEKVSLDNNILDSSQSSITIDSKDNISIAWTGTDKANNSRNILLRKYDSNLKPLTDQILVNKLPSNRSMVHLETDINDNLCVFFRGEVYNTYLKKYDKNGNVIK